jgi:hypothetical protein
LFWCIPRTENVSNWYGSSHDERNPKQYVLQTSVCGVVFRRRRGKDGLRQVCRWFGMLYFCKDLDGEKYYALETVLGRRDSIIFLGSVVTTNVLLTIYIPR